MAEVMSTYTENIIWANFDISAVISMKTNGADIKPGHVVTNYGESNTDDIDLCAAGEPPFGVAIDHLLDDGDQNDINKEQLDIDTAYTDNSIARIAPIGCGMGVYLFGAGQATTTIFYKGSRLVAAADGEVGLPTFATTTEQLNNDANGFVGRSASYNTGGSTAVILAAVI